MASDSSHDGAGGSSSDADSVGQRGENKVDYGTYEKTVGEVKSLKQQLAERNAELKKFHEAQREAENKKQLEEKNFTGVIEQLRSENDSLKQENELHKRDKTDFRKMNAVVGVMNAKGIQIEDKYFGLIPLDQVLTDENGLPDKTSVAKVVADFQKEHPRLTLPPNKLLPNDRTSNGTPKISVEEWAKLPGEEKLKALKEKRVQHDYGF